MNTELGRTVISAISALSEMVIAYRVRSESNKVVPELQTQPTGSASDPWRWNAEAEASFITADELEQIVSNSEAPPGAEAALAAVPEAVLREILQHIDDETTRLRDSIADPSRSKSQRERDIDHAQAEICVELKTLKRHCGDVVPNVPRRALAKAWEQHRCS